MAWINIGDNMDLKSQIVPECLAFVTDDASLSIIKKLFNNFDLKNSHAFQGSVDYAKQYMKSSKLPKLLILDLSMRDVPMKDLSEIAALCDPSVKIVILSDQNDVNFCREVMQLGVEDYLLKPVHIIPLEELFMKTFKPNEFAKSKPLFKNGVLVGIMGSKGGIGASTIALNAGIILAKNRKKKTLVLDTNLYDGDINVLLDIQKDDCFIDAMQHNQYEIDDYIFEGMLTKTSYEKLSLMCGTKQFGENIDISDKQFDVLLKEIKNNFNYTIIDINPNCAGIYNSVASNLDMLFIISDLTIPSAINTAKIINFQKQKKLNSVITVVINKIGENTKGMIQQKVFEKVIGMPVQHFVMFEPNIVKASENTGIPIAENKSGKIYKNIENIVKDMCYEGIQQKFRPNSSSFIVRFFKKLFHRY